MVNLVEGGADLLLRTDVALTARDRGRLAGLAEGLGMPRISWALGVRGEAEPACALRPAVAAFGGWRTPVPPGAFLQASLEGEAAIQGAVVAALPRMKARGVVIELFAGVGSLTHALTARGAGAGV